MCAVPWSRASTGMAISVGTYLRIGGGAGLNRLTHDECDDLVAVQGFGGLLGMCYLQAYS